MWVARLEYINKGRGAHNCYSGNWCWPKLKLWGSLCVCVSLKVSKEMLIGKPSLTDSVPYGLTFTNLLF